MNGIRHRFLLPRAARLFAHSASPPPSFSQALTVEEQRLKIAHNKIYRLYQEQHLQEAYAQSLEYKQACSSLFGASHPVVASALGDTALMALELGDLDEAIALFASSLSMSVSHLRCALTSLSAQAMNHPLSPPTGLLSFAKTTLERLGNAQMWSRTMRLSEA